MWMMMMMMIGKEKVFLCSWSNVGSNPKIKGSGHLFIIEVEDAST